MRVAQIVGTVVLARSHPSLSGARLRLATPLSLSELQTGAAGAGESIVLWDELGAGQGSLVALSESSEAAQPFRPEIKPVDAYNAAILDTIDFNTPAS